MANKIDQIRMELQRIEKEHGGMLKPADVLAEAEDEMSILHSYFEWDDTEAAEAYRLFQARHLITSVDVEISGVKTQKYFSVSVTVAKEKTRGYFDAKTVMSDQQMYEQVLKNALVELEHWQQKYDSIKELHDVINESKVRKLKK